MCISRPGSQIVGFLFPFKDVSADANLVSMADLSKEHSSSAARG